MDLLQSQNLLLSICRFLYHSQISNYLLHSIASLNKIWFFVTVKLIEHIFSTVKVCSNPCIGPFPGIEMSFFPKINKF